MAYEPGQWNVICDRCGFKFKARQLRLEWNGYRTCYGPGTTGCWEPKHPLMHPKPPRPERQVPPWIRPEGPDRFVEADAAYVEPGYVVAGYVED